MENNQPRPYTFDRVVRMLLSALALGAALYVINLLKNVLGPFIIALFIAYLLDPLVNFVQNKMRVRHRGASVLLTVLSAGVMVVVILLYLVPAFIDEMNKMVYLIKVYLQAVDMREVLPFEMEKSIRELIKEMELVDYLSFENLTEFFKKVLPGFWNLFSGSMRVIAGIVGLLVVILYTIFILMDFQKIGQFGLGLIPARYREVTSEIFDDLGHSMHLYFRSQGLIALIVGILLAIGFKIIGLPMAIIIGLFIGALNIVPYLQLVGLIPALLLALLKAMESQQSFWHVAFLVLLVLGIVQLIQETVLVPRIMGKTYGMNPAIVLLALSIWGSLMGLMGLLLALPLTSVIVSYYKRFVLHEEAGEISNMLNDE
ncbi:AI-2E family transporter [Carboxylicivirga mesophila]|uniref:AI-2E family transporter n=1 Tax=Carboxylicivirga mesophila TaxID=1166478 RepID=A0ABS5K8H6_9BACT|nr:AI-2E family transporter [Carboxylicivirga mesophila]MBS2211187.1 AI-2E family transporter [Carboxylicivirga mesophila]